MKDNDGIGIDVIIDRAVRGDASDAELAHLAAWRHASPANERTYRDRVLCSRRRVPCAPTLPSFRRDRPPKPSSWQQSSAVFPPRVIDSAGGAAGLPNRKALGCWSSRDVFHSMRGKIPLR